MPTTRGGIMRDIQDFDNISIHLASPEMIRADVFAVQVRDELR